MKNDLFKELLAAAQNDYASIVDDGITGESDEYINTGSYTLNALLSGSIYKGLPNNKVTALAGEPATGKTFFAINIVRQFLKDNPNGFVFYFESESALTKNIFESRSVDTKRVVIMPVATVQQFRTESIRILDKYLQTDEKDRLPMLFVLDSLGNLSTEKEISDIAEGKDTRDMTRAQLIKGAFRVLTLKLGKAKVPLIVTNHIYDIVGSYVPMKKMSGGSGLEYAASTIVFLSKKKDKDKDGNITGAIITASLKKARMTVENKKVETLLDYANGIDPYYGLLDLAEKFKIVKKVGNKYEFPNGEKAFENAILNSPEKYFDDVIMKEIDDKCKGEFVYGFVKDNNNENK